MLKIREEEVQTGGLAPPVGQIRTVRIQQRLQSCYTLTTSCSWKMCMNFVLLWVLSPTCCLQSGGDLLILQVLSFVLVKHQEDILRREDTPQTECIKNCTYTRGFQVCGGHHVDSHVLLFLMLLSWRVDKLTVHLLILSHRLWNSGQFSWAMPWPWGKGWSQGN